MTRICPRCKDVECERWVAPRTWKKDFDCLERTAARAEAAEAERDAARAHYRAADSECASTIADMVRLRSSLAESGTGYSPQTVDAIVKERDALRAKLDSERWISVTDRLPTVRVKVFVRMEKHGFSVGERRDEPGCRAWYCAGFGYGIQEPADKVTHWRPFDAAREASNG